jgi:hypothetical protein
MLRADQSDAPAGGTGRWLIDPKIRYPYAKFKPASQAMIGLHATDPAPLTDEAAR